MTSHRCPWVKASEKGDHQDIMSFSSKSHEDRPNLRRVLSTQSPRKAVESQRLFMDNLKLWDCLALVRSDVSLSCQSAINLIFSLSNNDYLRAFPDALHFIHSHFADGQVRYSSAEEAEVEDMRLRQENIRLHAAVWVLRDNPGLQPDSALAAIFRLDDETFKNKFPFDYGSSSLDKLTSYAAHNLDTTDSCSKRNNRKTREHTSSMPRPRSASAKRKSGCKSGGTRQRSPPVTPTSVSRRSSSTWGREDFTSNRIPTVATWDHPHSPDPPMTITHGVRSQFKRSNRANRSFAIGHKTLSGEELKKKRSPSAMGRMEGHSGESEDEAELSQSATRAREDLHRCTAQLGLEVTSAGASSSKVKFSFVDPSYDPLRNRHSKTAVANQDACGDKSDFQTSNSMKFFCPINPSDWPDNNEHKSTNAPRSTAAEHKSTNAPRSNAPEHKSTNAPRSKDHVTSSEVRAAIREVIDQSEMMEPPSKKFHHRHQMANKHLNPDAALNKSSNNRYDLDLLDNQEIDSLQNPDHGGPGRFQQKLLNKTSENGETVGQKRWRGSRSVKFTSPDRSLNCKETVRKELKNRSSSSNESVRNDTKDRLPPLKLGSESGNLFGKEICPPGRQESQSSRSNVSPSASNDVNRIANDVNTNRIAYGIDSAGNVSGAENWLCSFTDQSISTQGHRISDFSDWNQTQRFCQEDRSEFKLNLQGLMKLSHLGLSPDRNPSIQILFSTKPAQHPIGTQYPIGQASTASGALHRHRRLQDRFGDLRSKQIYSEFDTKTYEPEFPVFADFNSPLKQQKTPSQQQQKSLQKSLQKSPQISPPQQVLRKSGESAQPTQQQGKVARDKQIYQQVKIIGAPPSRSSQRQGENTHKKCDLEDKTPNSFPCTPLSHIEEVSDVGWGGGMWSELEQRAGRLKGCHRPEVSKRQRGLDLLRKLPNTQVTRPLRRMIKRNEDKKQWLPDAKYRAAKMCTTTSPRDQDLVSNGHSWSYSSDTTPCTSLISSKSSIYYP